MYQQRTDALRFSRELIRILIGLNLALGVLIMCLFTATLLAPVPVMRALGVHAGPDAWRTILGMRLVMVVGLGGIPITHRMLALLLAMVETVKVGDAFVATNALRLKGIAWALVLLQLLHLLIGAIVTFASTKQSPLDIHWSFSPTSLLPVVLTFVLARVFEEGAHMREDLEGTV